ncbi:MFS transporter [Gordonia sp. zg691]|uniref:MFS transporter n=1 Tax=Gordonia jinghuaiqii TaxID=2758710 RepID=A0A7D7LVI3_9ACTN|nr:MFS transporter [Gordonia jinghuaiqii]MBD0862771.1 MFS transporter [Gordonia jinghuaiqii]MCR5979106.1 MFS transporter [Gordonia jinghuaiqii]QMT01575.1 MFS transporter [Gordonia jinghuaiqii]
MTVTEDKPTAGGATSEKSMLATFREQPRTVWITAFAATIAFMGIGLVDPILHSIAEALDAPPEKVTLLFGVYVGVQCVAMLLTGWAAYRFGAKRTLTVGLVLIVVAAGISAFADNIDQLIAFRVIWGLGNALFLATALAFIVSAATGSRQGAIMMYEAALGIGLAVGPLLGATLGEWTWRAPFAGTALLMLFGAVLCAVMLPADAGRATRQRVRIVDPLKALRNRTLAISGIGSAFYTGALFTVIAWAPIAMGLRPIHAGLIFFGWGLLTAIAGVFVAPALARTVGSKAGVLMAITAYGLVMVLAGVGTLTDQIWLIGLAVILSGLPSGTLNTLFTDLAMSSGGADTPRSVSSAGFSFLRWMGAAIAAVLVAYLAKWFGSEAAPWWFAAGYCVVALGAVALIQVRSNHEVDDDAALIGAEEF